MPDFILVDGDEAIFIPNFGPAQVVVKPGKLKASGKDVIDGKKMCVLGDEKSVEVKGCMYKAGAFVVPGKGKLVIQKLGPTQIAKKKKTSNGKKVLLVGKQFEAEFIVTQPASLHHPPGPPIPDPVPKYTGQGKFKSKNTKEKAE